MRQSIFIKTRLWVGLFLPGVVLFPTESAAGQEMEGAHFGVGFVANAPSQMVGGGGYVVLPYLGGIGLYLDVKADVESPANDRAFEEGLTSAEVVADPRYAGTHFVKRETSWRRSYNAALVRPLNPFLMVYAGAGLTQGERYALYDVPQVEIGRALWVRDPVGDEDRLNMMLGLILRMGPRFSSQFGFETQPRGITAGMSLSFPAGEAGGTEVTLQLHGENSGFADSDLRMVS